MYNKLLQRQIRRQLNNIPEIPEEYKQIFTAISDSYDHYESDRAMLERSLELSSKELNQANSKIKNAYNTIEEKNKDITDSINYAKKIQEAILPSNEYIKSLFPDSFVLFKPKDIVSGDFYWFAEKDGKFFAVAADCTGHGVPGAFMSMIGSSLLSEIVIERGTTEPGKILQTMKEGIIRSLKQTREAGRQKDGMDIAMCAYDSKNKIVEYAGAYNPLYHVRNNEVTEIRADRMPIGIYEDNQKTFTNNHIEVQEGDSLYVFSDGYVDQFGGPKGKKLMSKKFKDIIHEIQDMSMDEQGKRLNKIIEEWKTFTDQNGNAYDQMDDILVIGIKI